jgi:beta-mannosidase
MNMLRVWGGGQYEYDYFYEICDRLGILVWQDFMFSCSLYPVDDEFLANVTNEAEYQVKRLLPHACLALLCGNNENEVSFKWFEASRHNPLRYQDDYRKLYYDTLEPLVTKLAPDVPWWPSSPSTNDKKFEDHPGVRDEGDSHSWDVWHQKKPFEDYTENVPRFCSEYGFQSFSSLETVRTYAAEDQFDILSEVMLFHQRSSNGNLLINDYFERYFRKPESFEDFLYLSQVEQAYGIKMGTEYWRTQRPYCMGALYWQLNDNWPVASWSSIEHNGKWKLLHYAATKFFAPVLVCAFSKPGSARVDVYCVNDTLDDVPARVNVRFYDFSGNMVLHEEIFARLEKEASVVLKSYDIDSMKIDPQNTFLYLTCEYAGESIDNLIFLTTPKNANIRKPDIGFSFKMVSARSADVIVKTDIPAFYVALDMHGIKGRWSDNCFTLIPGIEKRVAFETDGAKVKLNADALGKSMHISYLR